MDEYHQHIKSRQRLAIYASPYGDVWLASRLFEELQIGVSTAIRWDEALQQDRMADLCEITHRAEMVCALHGALQSEL